MAAQAAAARGRRTRGLRHSARAIALAAGAALLASACARSRPPADPADFHLTIGVAADSAGHPRVESKLVARGAWAELERTTLGPEEAARLTRGALLVERFTAPLALRGKDAGGDWVFDFVLYETPAWHALRRRGMHPYGVEVGWSDHYTAIYDQWGDLRRMRAPSWVRKRFALDRRHVRGMVLLIENGRTLRPWDDSGLLSPPAGDSRRR